MISHIEDLPAESEAERNIYNPSPETIDQVCQQIQQGWSRREFLKRSGYRSPVRWHVPEVTAPRESIPSLVD